MRQRRLIHRVCPVLLAAAVLGNVHGGSLERLSEVDLKKALQNEHLGASQSYKVMKLLFSPDAGQLAVLLMGGTIVLLGVQDPKTVLGKFQNDGHDFFGWSPDSQIIFSGRHVVRLADGKACDLPPNAIFPKFVGKGSLVALFLGAVRIGPSGGLQQDGSSHLRLFDVDCQEQDSWEVPASWLSGDASPERGLLSISVVESSPWPTELIVSPFEKKILHRWSEQNAPRGFCWDVDTGKKIISGRSIRIVWDDYRDTGMAARRRIWDFTAGKELVSWPLKFITYGATFDLDGFNRDRRPIPSAISSDGEYLAEGGDGKIWLSRIQP
ncbi:MAG TPA: hypothetical protein VGG72_14110 [Bryobacteraceae bacterium]|jgi:hypothetical protein